MKKRYRCTECGNIFYDEEPIPTIPTSVVWCPRCKMLAKEDGNSPRRVTKDE